MGAPNFVIGKDIRLMGRLARLLFGIVPFTIFVVQHYNANALFRDVVMLSGKSFLYFLLITLVYVGAYSLLKDRVLTKMSPWIGTLLFLVPAFVVTGLKLGPIGFQMGFSVFLGVSGLVSASIGFGGLLALSIPILLFGKPKEVVAYCPFNLVDAAEKRIAGK